MPLADSDIRPLLREWLRARHEGDPETVILDELGICRGRVRIDLTVVNGLLHGYEIKSDRDTLARLATQGVILAEQRRVTPRFVVRRRGARNPRVDASAIVEFLWREDAIALLETRGAAAGLRSKTRFAMWDRIREVCGVEEIAAAARARLKAKADLREPAQQS